MGKTTTELGDDGRPVTYKSTRARRKSESRLIPLTPGPQTRLQRIVRAAVG
jgi:hypothetical protein